MSEGLAPLAQFLLKRSPVWSDWPATVRDALNRAARKTAAADMVGESELRTVLDAFAGAGIGNLLLKGAALAYTHYPLPALRTRCDTDLFVASDSRAAATTLLRKLGYRRAIAHDHTLASYQECFEKADGGFAYVIDLHWQISNRQAFARALPYDEVIVRSVAVAPLGPAARTLCSSDALLLACMHRASHLGFAGSEEDRLLWLYDMHLLATAMSCAQWEEFAALCKRKAMRGLSADALDCVRKTFRTSIPAAVLTTLHQHGGRENSLNYLRSHRLQILLADLREMPGWRARVILLKETLIPPTPDILAKYGSQRRWLLPWWYLRRIAEALMMFTRAK